MKTKLRYWIVDVIGVMTEISAEREYIRDGKITKMVMVILELRS
jgi:hypothetical protein